MILTQLHLDLFRKGRKTAFSQPCSCFDGKLCSIYADRPKQCRAFECGLIKRVSANQFTTGAALKVIADTRRRSDAILKLVRELGHVDETKPLNQRYAAVVSQPIDMAADEADLERRGELMMSVANLMKSLQRDFLA